MNLLDETLQELRCNGLSFADIEWVGSASGEYALTWEEFADLIEDVEYDCGYGGQEIVADLVVVGPDWWMERDEYDGSEWWAVKRKPQRQHTARPFTKVKRGLWENIAD